MQQVHKGESSAELLTVREIIEPFEHSRIPLGAQPNVRLEDDNTTQTCALIFLNRRTTKFL